MLEYDGGAFSGWQIQQNAKSIQGELEKALQVYLSSEARKRDIQLEEEVRITASGRTDAQVSAKAQVISFTWPHEIIFSKDRFIEAVNGLTPREISMIDAVLVAPSFDARHSPHTKCYCYSIFNRKVRSALHHAASLWVREALDIESMQRAASLLVGTHDFAGFRASDCSASSTVRTILSSEFTKNGDMLEYRIVGKGFLKQMVRAIVGTLLEIGRGKSTVESMNEVLEKKERNLAGPTVPGFGLMLEWVRYQDEKEFFGNLSEFQSSREGSESAKPSAT